MEPFAAFPFIGAANYTPAARAGVDLVVLHSAETQERPRTARAIAGWFAGDSAPRASAHWAVDDLETIQCVPEKAIAWAAPGANANGVHVEMAGRASQTVEEWFDDYSLGVLTRTADLVAGICTRWNIPPAFVEASGLIQKARGITTHAEVSQAFHRSTHWDPGPHFPIDWFCRRVERLLKEGTLPGQLLLA